MPTRTRRPRRRCPPITVTGRLDRLRADFDEHEIDALVVTTLANVRYLTGFSGSAGVLDRDRRTGALLTTDGRYRTQSAEQLEQAGAAGRSTSPSAPAAEQRKAAQAALDGRRRRPHRPRGRQRHLERRSAPGPSSSAATGSSPPPTPSRRCASARTPAEIARMERAAAIADAALFEVLPLMGQGVDRGALRPRARHGHAARRGREHAPSRPSWPPARTRPSRTTTRAPGASTAATRWWSTSAPPSRATART